MTYKPLKETDLARISAWLEAGLDAIMKMKSAEGWNRYTVRSAIQRIQVCF